MSLKLSSKGSLISRAFIITCLNSCWYGLVGAFIPYRQWENSRGLGEMYCACLPSLVISIPAAQLSMPGLRMFVAESRVASLPLPRPFPAKHRHLNLQPGKTIHHLNAINFSNPTLTIANLDDRVCAIYTHCSEHPSFIRRWLPEAQQAPVEGALDLLSSSLYY